MNKLILLFVMLATLVFIKPWPVFSQEEASSSAVDFNTIKENVKERLERIVKGDHDELESKVAYMGILESVATTTLSIKTDEGIKLASTSATTSFIRLPKNTKISLEDVGIEEYVVTIGTLDEAEVMNARRVIVQKDPPKEPTDQVEYGIIQTAPDKKKFFTVTNSTGTEKSFLLVKNSHLTIGTNPDNVTEAKISDLQPGIPVLIVYTPAANEEDDNTIIQLLLRAIPQVEPTPTPKSTPAPKTIPAE